MRLGLVAGALALAVGLGGCVDDTPTTTTSAQNRNVRIVNQTGRTIWSMNASRSSSNLWGGDIFGPYTLPSGTSRTFNFNDGTGACIFDFRFNFRDGSTYERYRINVCTTASYTLH